MILVDEARDYPATQLREAELKVGTRWCRLVSSHGNAYELKEFMKQLEIPKERFYAPPKQPWLCYVALEPTRRQGAMNRGAKPVTRVELAKILMELALTRR